MTNISNTYSRDLRVAVPVSQDQVITYASVAHVYMEGSNPRAVT